MSQPLQEPLLKCSTHGELTRAQVFNPLTTSFQVFFSVSNPVNKITTSKLRPFSNHQS